MARRKFPILILATCLIVTAVGRATEKWRFIVTGDSRGSIATGINGQILSEMATETLRWDVDFIVFPGDLVHGVGIGCDRFESQLWNWVRAMEPVYSAGISVYVCRGNHEVADVWYGAPDAGLDPPDNYALRWLRVFGNDAHPEVKLPDNGPTDEKHMSYAVAHKNALVVSLDQYAGLRHRVVHSVNQSWLDSQLEANTMPHVFAFGHEPAFRTYHPDCLDDYPDKRDAFWRSLKGAGGRLYFCAHDHYYDHARVDDGDGDPDNDIHQLIVACAGAPSYSFKPPYIGDNSHYVVSQLFHAERWGYVIVEIDDLDVTTTWMERRNNDPWQAGVYTPKYVWSYSVDPNPAPCAVKLAADLNGDCRVDFADLAILASEWLASGQSPKPPASVHE